MASRDGPSHRALVAGAGGYLGGAIVRALIECGWQVRGLVSRPIGRPRGEPAASYVVGSILDRASVEIGMRDCELAVHVAARDPDGPGGPGEARSTRVEGCRNLLRAAEIQGVRRVVVGSGYWVYADSPELIREDSALDPRGESRINFETEQAALDRRARDGLEILVIRPGMVYGNGSWFRPAVDAIRAGTYRYVGDGSNAWSFVALEDAGSGFARVAEAGTPGQVYDLVDGRPAAWKDWGDFVADQVGRPRPSSLSRAEAERAFGPDIAHHLQARRACAGDKIRALGWEPRYPDIRAGLTALLPQMLGAAHRPE